VLQALPQDTNAAVNGGQRLLVLHQYRQQHPQPTLQQAPMQQFEVESETPVHQRYLTVYNRKVRFSAPDKPSEVGQHKSSCFRYSSAATALVRLEQPDSTPQHTA